MSTVLSATEPSPNIRSSTESCIEFQFDCQLHITAQEVPECSICLCEIKPEDPDNLKLTTCGHQFHKECLTNQINAGAGTDHLTFQYICCALCRSLIVVPELEEILAPMKKLKEATDLLALSVVTKEPELFPNEAEFELFKQRPESEQLQFAYHKLTFYECCECGKPYCGGAISCAEAVAQQNKESTPESEEEFTTTEQDETVPKEEEDEVAPKVTTRHLKRFMCIDCSAEKICDHSVEHLTFKCIKCCAESVFYCLGTEFYCDRCHSDLSTLYPCPGVDECPLGIPHPENQVGTHGGGPPVIPFVLRCSICGPKVVRETTLSSDQCSVLLN